MTIETNYGEYEGLNYEINIFDNESSYGSSYKIFEYTPITHIKCIVQSGVSCDPTSYTKDKVKSIIRLIVEESKEN